MEILCIGCTGFLGGAVRRILYESGMQVRVLTRSQLRAIRMNEGVVPFDSDWMAYLSQVDAVINLAGESISKWPWNAKRKSMILESRVGLMNAMVDRMAHSPKLPRIWVNASAVGFYGNRGEEMLAEDSAPGRGFLAEVAQQWEASVSRLAMLGIREVRLRFGPILGANGGMLPPMAKAFRLGLGGPVGNGAQYLPWVHLEDAAQAVVFALEHALHGPVNVVAPGIVRQKQFAERLGDQLRRPAFLPAPAWALRVVLGEFSSLLLDSQKAMPQVLKEYHFPFCYPELDDALEEALG